MVRIEVIFRAMSTAYFNFWIVERTAQTGTRNLMEHRTQKDTFVDMCSFGYFSLN